MTKTASKYRKCRYCGKKLRKCEVCGAEVGPGDIHTGGWHWKGKCILSIEGKPATIDEVIKYIEDINQGKVDSDKK